MTIATVTFDRCDDYQDWDQVDIVGLHEHVMDILGRHFQTYHDAAEALSQHDRTIREINESAPHLFSAFERARAGFAAHPPAQAWRAYLAEACPALAPFSFTIRFSQIGEDPRNQTRGNDHGGQSTGIQPSGPD